MISKLRFKVDELVKSRKKPLFVIPAEAGIQYFQRVTKNLDPVFQRGDDFLRVHHVLAQKKSLNPCGFKDCTLFP
jgi:hypothetical protein